MLLMLQKISFIQICHDIYIGGRWNQLFPKFEFQCYENKHCVLSVLFTKLRILTDYTWINAQREITLTQKNLKCWKFTVIHFKTPEKKVTNKQHEHVSSNILLSYETFTINKACSTKLYSYIILYIVNGATECEIILMFHVQLKTWHHKIIPFLTKSSMSNSLSLRVCISDSFLLTEAVSLSHVSFHVSSSCCVEVACCIKSSLAFLNFWKKE
jgi:hypothetical protein